MSYNLPQNADPRFIKNVWAACQAQIRHGYIQLHVCKPVYIINMPTYCTYLCCSNLQNAILQRNQDTNVLIEKKIE